MDDKLPADTLHFIGSHPSGSGPARYTADGGGRLVIDTHELGALAEYVARFGDKPFHVALWPAEGNGGKPGEWT